MPQISLELPTLQNWNCQNCSGCCRQHLIEITEEERQRILGQGWTEADGVLPADQLIVPVSKLPWVKGHRLGHQADGACAFLDDNGLCRIHAKFGEAAKPLACRVYPYAFHPHGKKVTVSLRYSCPSVVGNKGQPVAGQTKEIQAIAREVVPKTHRDAGPPEITSGEKLDWQDFDRFVKHLDATFAEPDVPISLKLRRALCWLGLVESARFDEIRGTRLEELLVLLTAAASDEVTGNMDAIAAPTAVGRSQFRLLVAQYARKDTFAESKGGFGQRWKLLLAAMRMARGRGNVPALQDCFSEVPFEQLEQPFGGLPEGAEEIFSRYFCVKIQGLHFCGPAYYDVPFVEGFQSLALVYPSIVWIARWLAASAGRTSLTISNIELAMTIADHHHGYSPIFGSGGFRRRVRVLAKLDDIQKLCTWYSR